MIRRFLDWWYEPIADEWAAYEIKLRHAEKQLTMFRKCVKDFIALEGGTPEYKMANRANVLANARELVNKDATRGFTNLSGAGPT